MHSLLKKILDPPLRISFIKFIIRVALEHLSSLEKKYHEQANKLQKEIANLQKNVEG